MHSAVCVVVHGRMCVLDGRVGRVLRNALFRTCNCASALSLLTSPAPCSSGTRRSAGKWLLFKAGPGKAFSGYILVSSRAVHWDFCRCCSKKTSSNSNKKSSLLPPFLHNVSL